MTGRLRPVFLDVCSINTSLCNGYAPTACFSDNATVCYNSSTVSTACFSGNTTSCSSSSSTYLPCFGSNITVCSVDFCTQTDAGLMRWARFDHRMFFRHERLYSWNETVAMLKLHLINRLRLVLTGSSRWRRSFFHRRIKFNISKTMPSDALRFTTAVILLPYKPIYPPFFPSINPPPPESFASEKLGEFFHFADPCRWRSCCCHRLFVVSLTTRAIKLYHHFLNGNQLLIKLDDAS